MKKSFYFFVNSIILFLLWGTWVSNAPAQSIQILKVDNSKDRQISLDVWIQNKSNIDLGNLWVKEDNNSKKIDIRYINHEDTLKSSRKTYIGILVESSYFVSVNGIFKKFQAGLSGFLEDQNFVENKKFAVFSYSFGLKKGNALRFLGEEFSSDVGFWSEGVETNLKGTTNSKKREIELFKGIYESLDFFEKTQLPNSSRSLILISTGLNRSSSPIEIRDCIEKAQKYDVSVHTIAYTNFDNYAFDYLRLISSQTDGIFITADSTSDIRNALQTILNEIEDSSPPSIKVRLTYRAEKISEELNHIIEVGYEDLRDTFMYYTDLPISIDSAFKPKEGNNHVEEFPIEGEKMEQDVDKPFLFGIISLLLIGFLIVIFWWRRKDIKSGINEYPLQKDHGSPSPSLPEVNKYRAPIELSEEMEREFSEKKVARRSLDKTTIRGNEALNSPPFLLVMEDHSIDIISLNLHKQVYTVGRYSGNDIVLDDPTVSKFHAQLLVQGSEIILEDLESKNGSFLNGKRVSKASLRPGDNIIIGNIQIQLKNS